MEIGKKAFYGGKYLLEKLDNMQAVEILGEGAFICCADIKLCVFPNLKKIETMPSWAVMT